MKPLVSLAEIARERKGERDDADAEDGDVEDENCWNTRANASFHLECSVDFKGV